jgi:excisionase family DNA binding protein
MPPALPSKQQRYRRTVIHVQDDPNAALPPILTMEEVAAYLRIGRSSAYELARTGMLPAIRLGRTLRVSRAALLAWVEAQAQSGQKQAAGASWQGQPAGFAERSLNFNGNYSTRR